ncbi:MAG: FimV/HubP family polar landmark protein [Pseudomonadota bacterium]
MRKLPLALACAAILGTTNAYAVGMGELHVHSHLNQPLQAEIPLIDATANDIEALSARLADEAAFERFGLSRAAVSGRIHLRIQGGKQPRIVLGSDAPVRDPAMGIVVQLSGPDGTLMRDYSILLDPLGYRPGVASGVAPRNLPAPVQSSAPSVQPYVQPYIGPTSVVRGPIAEGAYGPVSAGETLYSIANGSRPEGVSVRQAMNAIRRANPQAFNSAGVLMAGANLHIPSADEMRRAPDTPQSLPKASPVPVTAPTAASVASPEPKDAPSPSTQVKDSAAPQEPRLAIVEPTAPATASSQPPAPVVGEVVATPQAAAPGEGGVASEQPAQMVEQIEAMRAENESLGQRIATLDTQMKKMEELLHLKDLQIQHLEKLLAEGGMRPQTPQPAVQSAPADDDSSLLAGLGVPALLAASGVVVLALAFLFGRSRRRREQQDDDLAGAAPIAAPATAVFSSAVAASSPAEPSAVEVAPVNAPAPAPERSDAPVATDPLTEALEEADVMLAYGLHDRAIKVLDEAMMRMPDAPALAARKLKVLHDMGARDEFLHGAEAFRAAFPDDDAFWPSIKAMGESAYADSPLFGGQEVAEQPAPRSAPVAESVSMEPVEFKPEPSASAEPLADLSMPLELPVAEPVSVQPPVASVSPVSVDDELLLPMQDLAFSAPPVMPSAPANVSEPLELPPLELELPDITSIGTPPAVPKSASQPIPDAVPETEATEPLDLSLSAPAAVVQEAPAPASEQPAPVQSHGVSEDDLMMLGLDLANLDHDQELAVMPPEAAPEALAEAESREHLAHFDEQAAKLDIAQAFIDMSDEANARVLLEEVLRDGSEFQQARAQEMLHRLGG